MKIVYGMNIQDMNDEYVITAQTAVEGLSISHIPGAFLVEYFPLLRFLPSWVPGVTFKKFGRHYLTYVEKMRNQPFDIVKTGLVYSRSYPTIFNSD